MISCSVGGSAATIAEPPIVAGADELPAVAAVTDCAPGVVLLPANPDEHMPPGRGVLFQVQQSGASGATAVW